MVAEWNGDRLTVWTSTQKVFLVRSGLADLFDLPEDKIRVIGSKVGAGFGGKNAMRLEPYAAALALKTGKPVRLVNSRAEEFSAAAGSVPATVRVKTGVKKDGTITARAMEFTWDTGAYAEGLAGSNRALKDGVGPYKIPNIRVSSTLVYTNKLRGCPFRGLGIPGSGMGRRIADGYHCGKVRHRSGRASAEKLSRYRRRNSGRRSRQPYRPARVSAEGR